jgi:hypothetical protein
MEELVDISQIPVADRPLVLASYFMPFADYVLPQYSKLPCSWDNIHRMHRICGCLARAANEIDELFTEWGKISASLTGITSFSLRELRDVCDGFCSMVKIEADKAAAWDKKYLGE